MSHSTRRRRRCSSSQPQQQSHSQSQEKSTVPVKKTDLSPKEDEFLTELKKLRKETRKESGISTGTGIVIGSGIIAAALIICQVLKNRAEEEMTY